MPSHSFISKVFFQVLIYRINTLSILKINLGIVGNENFLEQIFEINL